MKWSSHGFIFSRTREDSKAEWVIGSSFQMLSYRAPKSKPNIYNFFFFGGGGNKKKFNWDFFFLDIYIENNLPTVSWMK